LPRLCLAGLLISLGAVSGAAGARDVHIEVEVMYISGRITAGQVDAMLADERLRVDVSYDPTTLIPGVTAKSERIMPIGRKLFPIYQHLQLQGQQVERQGRLLRFQLPGSHPEHPTLYRLSTVAIRTPQGASRSQLMSLELRKPPDAGDHESVRLFNMGPFELGTRVRFRWSDARGPTAREATRCDPVVQLLPSGEYRFRRSHRFANEFRGLASDAQSDPPSRPRAGHRSFRMREPYPEPLAGWEVSRNHLVQRQIDGQVIERYSVYARQGGQGQCHRTRSYEALYADGRIVELEHTQNENECAGADSRAHRYVSARWLEDSILDRYVANLAAGERRYDGFLANSAEQCEAAGAPPPAEEIEALVAEASRIRQAFLRP
jgi:hypothetical protein